jgi:hypothetical protein
MRVEALSQLTFAEEEQEVVEALQEGLEGGLELLSTTCCTSLATTSASAQAPYGTARCDIIEQLFRLDRLVCEIITSRDLYAKIV